MSVTSATNGPERGKVPQIVWVTCALLFAFALLAGLTAVLLWKAIAEDRVSGTAVTASLAITVGLAVVYVVVAVFLFRKATWARWLGLSLGLLNIIVAVVQTVSTGQIPNCLGLVLQLSVVVLLLRHEIAAWCASGRTG